MEHCVHDQSNANMMQEMKLSVTNLIFMVSMMYTF